MKCTFRSLPLRFGLVLLMLGVVATQRFLPAQTRPDKKEPIPHGQTQPPGPALSPAEAIKKMKVPEGFTVELVASEPDLVNPVAMTFDERGRIWVTESLEYPRRPAGPGRDRVKVLEDTDGDGKVDRITVFAEGLNIPSGIAVGHGGVWVANAPDILFYKEGPDGKAAAKPEVVVSGFGRDDTHELPNSLTWGPDGWLYGLNGVFNHSHVKHQGKEFDFTCALFRIHPKTREFQLFCEGTSNPWGVAFDAEGSAFVSACVIDHLWHLTETGYYHRQGGPYPPFTWKIESIVKHKHQKAAYCGIHYFDSDAYPPEYRDRLYMGNIHGGCVNVDVLQRHGSTYVGKGAPDFLTANDAWFMPVVQKTGPDGCLYVLDWYDRYHCYQDANRDPKGIDRLRGRLYRIRYKDTPRAPKFDLARESDEQLIKRLHSPNNFYRDLAQRLLCERNHPETRAALEKLVLSEQAPRKARLHALWSLVGTGSLTPSFHEKLLAHRDATFRAWGVRAAGNFGKVEPSLRDRVVSLAKDPSADVQLQVAIAARKLQGVDAIPLLVEVLSRCGQDVLIPHIVWQNLHPLLETQSAAFIKLVEKADLQKAQPLAALLPRAIERILAARKLDAPALAGLLALLSEGRNANPVACGQCLALLATKVQTGELSGDSLMSLQGRIAPLVARMMKNDRDQTLALEATALAASWRDPAALERMRTGLADPRSTEEIRAKALAALIAANDAGLLPAVRKLFKDRQATSARFRGEVLGLLGKWDHPQVATVILDEYPSLESELQPRAIELLTQRRAWSDKLLQAIASKKIPATALNVNQVRKMLASKDPALAARVREVWGTFREDRNPEREKIVNEMRAFLRKTPGNARAGMLVFKNVCAQCHKIHGEGQEVGPDITSNGRADFEQLLSNVFDPSLVIGAGYIATTVNTRKGQVITGLVVENSPQRIVLKIQGGKLETIARGDVEEVFVSKVSLMPEGLEKQIKPQELADLFAFLTLDRPPTDSSAKKIPGAPR